MHAARSSLSAVARRAAARPVLHHRRRFHVSPRAAVVKPFLLADIGEGITECQLIQWFVQPGARVEQFDKLCEVQSDKASVEITSPFDGVIKKLHYEPDDMAITGKPLVDIDIQGEISAEDEEKVGGGGAEAASGEATPSREAQSVAADTREAPAAQQTSQRPERSHMGSLATPAVRHLIRQFNVEIADIQGSGKDGRVLKEDVHRHVSQQKESTATTTTTTTPSATAPSGEDRTVALTAVQNAMFKAMTRSLSIPHFLYTSSADMSAISALRQKLNAAREPGAKLTHLAFIMKAVSIAFQQHPLLNASLDTSNPKKPMLTYKSAHDFGIAVDSPTGLLVPVVRNVQNLSITEIARQMRQLSDAARTNKLKPGDFAGATFTVSNIGSVGGGVVAPVISEPQVAIVGVGRSRVVPAFDAHGQLCKREELVFSWSADHRVVDGAECARCAERVKGLLEDPSAMMVELR